MSDLLVPAAWTLGPGTACPACRASPAAAGVAASPVDGKVALQQHTHTFIGHSEALQVQSQQQVALNRPDLISVTVF